MDDLLTPEEREFVLDYVMARLAKRDKPPEEGTVVGVGLTTAIPPHVRRVRCTLCGTVLAQVTEPENPTYIKYQVRTPTFDDEESWGGVCRDRATCNFRRAVKDV